MPRSWTNLVAEVTEQSIPPQTDIPDDWRQYVQQFMGRPAPFHMTDGYEPWPKNWALGYDPADPLDAAVMATRNAVFPYLGLAIDNFGGM